MAQIIKDNVSNGTPVPVLPTGEQQIVVSTQENVSGLNSEFFLLIQVACRIRPMTEEEILHGATIISHKVSEDNV